EVMRNQRSLRTGRRVPLRVGSLLPAQKVGTLTVLLVICIWDQLQRLGRRGKLALGGSRLQLNPDVSFILSGVRNLSRCRKPLRFESSVRFASADERDRKSAE